MFSILKWLIFHFLVEMLLAPLHVKSTFRSLFVLQVYVLILVTSTRKTTFDAKLLKQCYRYFKTRQVVSKYYQRHSELIIKYNIGLALFCNSAYVTCTS